MNERIKRRIAEAILWMFAFVALVAFGWLGYFVFTRDIEAFFIIIGAVGLLSLLQWAIFNA